jgi:hypothetical protein
MKEFSTTLTLTRKQMNTLLIALEVYESTMKDEFGNDSPEAKALWDIIFEAGMASL